jgi:hypothetical protein
MSYPNGFDVWTHVEFVPKPPPPPEDTVTWTWTIGPVTDKPFETLVIKASPPTTVFHAEGITTVQLLATQQVQLSISGADKYGNPVEITGDTTWESSDVNIITIANVAPDNSSATAVTTGQVGTAAVTVTNDVNKDGTGDFIGSLAFDVVAGPMADIEVTAGTPTDKPA